MKHIVLSSIAVLLMGTLAEAGGDIAPVTEPIATKAFGGSLSLNYNRTHFRMDVSNGLGGILTDIFVNVIANQDDGAEFSDWGNRFEAEYVAPYNVDIFGKTAHPMIRIGHEKVDVIKNTFYTLPQAFLGRVGFVPLAIDGSIPVHGLLMFSGDNLGVNYELNHQKTYGLLGLTTTLDENQKFTVALYYSRQRTDLKSSVYALGAMRTNLNEKIRGYSVGPAIEYKIDKSVGEKISVFANLSAALLYTHGELDAFQTSIYMPADICINNEADDYGMNAQLEVGATYAFTSKLSWSISGGAGYRNDMYKIVNPAADGGMNLINPARYHPNEVHLEKTRERTYFFGTKITYNF